MATRRKPTPPQASRKAKPRTGLAVKQNLGKLPASWPPLKAKSLRDAIEKYDRYVENMETNIAQAQVHAKIIDRFLDVKYSSTAGQLGYMAAMILVDGFVVKYPLNLINFAPNPKVPKVIISSNRSIPAIEAANKKAFMTKGLHGRDAYENLLNLEFSDSLAVMFGYIYSTFHIRIHYQEDDSINIYGTALSTLLDFREEFVAEAEKKLKAAGITI